VTHVPVGTVIVYLTDPPTSATTIPTRRTAFFDHEIAAPTVH
jgi:hypothetical protein